MFEPGGVLRRVAAVVIDLFFLGLICYVIGSTLSEQLTFLGRWTFLVGVAIALVYFSTLESSVGKGQTLGKRLLNIRVAHADGSYLPWWQALVRYFTFFAPVFLNGRALPTEWYTSSVFLALLSVLFFGLGLCNLYLIVANKTRQGLHDLVVGAYVFRSPLITITRRINWNGHRAVASLIIVTSLILPNLVLWFSPFDGIGEIVKVQKRLDKLEGVTYSQVTDTTSYHDDGPTKYVDAVLAKFHESEGDAELAAKACTIVWENYPASSKRDFVRIIFSYGWDVGLASYWHSAVALTVEPKSASNPCIEGVST